jgi:hypothetical protein
MPAASLVLSASKRTGFPHAVANNVLVEGDGTSQSEPQALIARFGLAAVTTVGSAPIRAVFQKQGLFDNDALILADTTLYRLSASGVATALAGTVAGDDFVDIDAALDADLNSVARIATGTALYLVDATTNTVTQENFPDSANAGATSVQHISGYWIGTENGTDSAYYIEPAGSTWGALEFAAAEYAPDKLKGAKVAGEIIWLLGESTLEGWRVTGDSGSPLEPLSGLKFDIGCKTLFGAVNCRGTLIFVDADGSVRMATGGEPAIISDPGLAELIAATAVADIRASFWVKDQHPIYQITLGSNGTHLYDLAAKRWTTASSQGLDYWKADLFCNQGDTVLARDATSNQILRLDTDLATDDGETFPVEFCAVVETKERAVPIANVELHCEMGGAPLTGQGSSPKAVMQASQDGTKTYGGPREIGLGATGNYSKRALIATPGLTARSPHGLWLKFQISDPVRRRISGVAVNVT